MNSTQIVQGKIQNHIKNISFNRTKPDMMFHITFLVSFKKNNMHLKIQ